MSDKVGARWRAATQGAAAATLWSLIMLVVVGSSGNSLTTDSTRLAWALVFPVAVCLSAVILSFWHGVGPSTAMWFLVIVLGLFVFITRLSIGLLYVPALLALTYAAVRNSSDA